MPQKKTLIDLEQDFWIGIALICLFKGISTFVCYLMLKPSL